MESVPLMIQLQHMLDLLRAKTAFVASIECEASGGNGLPPDIYPNRLPQELSSYKDAMSRIDYQEWDDSVQSPLEWRLRPRDQGIFNSSVTARSYNGSSKQVGHWRLSEAKDTYLCTRGSSDRGCGLRFSRYIFFCPESD